MAKRNGTREALMELSWQKVVCHGVPFPRGGAHMKRDTFLLVRLSSSVAGVGTAVAGPCTARIDDVSKQLASRDAGLRPDQPRRFPDGAGSGRQRNRCDPGAGQRGRFCRSHRNTRSGAEGWRGRRDKVTPAMNAATQGRATSPSDARAQSQGQPTGTNRPGCKGVLPRRTTCVRQWPPSTKLAPLTVRARRPTDECSAASQPTLQHEVIKVERE